MNNNKKYTLKDLILDLADSFDWTTSKLVANTKSFNFVVDEESHKNRSPNPYVFPIDTPSESYLEGPNPAFEVTIRMADTEEPDELGHSLKPYFQLTIKGDFMREGNWETIFSIGGSASFNTMGEAMEYLFSYQTSTTERNSSFADIHPDHIIERITAISGFVGPQIYRKASGYVDLPRGIAKSEHNQKLEITDDST